MRSVRSIILCTVSVAAFLAVPHASAATVAVDCASEDLQSAINSASAGDTLSVMHTCTGNFTVDKNLTIQGYASAILDGNATGTTIWVKSGNVTLRSLTITSGLGDSGSCAGAPAVCSAARPGGILAEGSALTLDHVTVSGNTGGSGGSIPLYYQGENGNPGAAGGIQSSGTLTITDSTISGNKGGGGTQGGQGTWGTFGVSGHLVPGGAGGPGGNGGTGGNGGDGGAGGIQTSGPATITGSSITGNIGGTGGIGGDGGTGGDAGDGDDDPQWSYGGAGGVGGPGGDGGTGGNGGTGGLRSLGVTQLSNTTVSGNQGGFAGRGGGGGSGYDGGWGGYGSIGFGDGGDGGDGGNGGVGGIGGDGGITGALSTLGMTATTVAFNVGAPKGQGGSAGQGGVPGGPDFSAPGGTGSSGSSGEADGSGGIGGAATIASSLIAKNTSPRNAPGPDDCSRGTITSTGYNLLGVADTCTFAGSPWGTYPEQSGTAASPLDPKIAALADNGGPTKTHALLAGSPAIDLVPVGSSCPSTDQRGVKRPGGATCDAGAFEINTSTKLSFRAKSEAPQGSVLKISGRLSAGNPDCVENRNVTLMVGTTPAATTQTAATGAYRFQYMLTQTTKMKVTFAGLTGCDAASSPAKKIYAV